MNSVTKIPFLEGEKIVLRGLERKDVEGKWFNWFNDSRVTQFTERGVYPNTREGLLEFYRKSVKGGNDLVLAIIWKQNGQHIGNVGLHRIDWVHRRSEFAIVIGEKGYWGRGVGSEAAKLIKEHGFRKLNLHKIFLGVRVDHKAAVKVYKKAGFKIEGRLREEVYRNHKYWDIYIMSAFNPKS